MNKFNLLMLLVVTVACLLALPNGGSAQQGGGEAEEPENVSDTVEIPAGHKEDVSHGGSGAWVRIKFQPDTGWGERRDESEKVKAEFKSEDDIPDGVTMAITKIIYQTEEDEGNDPETWSEADVSGATEGGASQADLPDDLHGQEFYVQVKFYKNGTEHTPVGSYTLNYICTDNSLNAVTSMETGGDTVAAFDGGNKVTLFDIAQNFLGMQAADFNEPDLMFWCDAPINSGSLMFVPAGEFRFEAAPEPENVHIFDRYGNDLSNDIDVDGVSVTARGDVSLEVAVIDPQHPPFGVIVRGTPVEMNQNADENSVHGYTIGGSAVSHLLSDVCAIADGTRVLNNWETLNWTPDYDWGQVEADIAGSQDPVTIGAPFTSVVGGETNTGYRWGIVLEGDSAGAIRDGSLTVRGVYGLQFDLDESAEVYLIDADSGDDLYDQDIEATLATNAYGDLTASFANVESYTSSERVKVVITGLKVTYNAPIAHGVAYDLVTFGGALRAPLHTARPFIEGGDPEDDPPADALPDEAIEVTGWTPVASVD